MQSTQFASTSMVSGPVLTRLRFMKTSGEHALVSVFATHGSGKFHPSHVVEIRTTDDSGKTIDKAPLLEDGVGRVALSMHMLRVGTMKHFNVVVVSNADRMVSGLLTVAHPFTSATAVAMGQKMQEHAIPLNDDHSALPKPKTKSKDETTDTSTTVNSDSDAMMPSRQPSRQPVQNIVRQQQIAPLATASFDVACPVWSGNTQIAPLYFRKRGRSKLGHF